MIAFRSKLFVLGSSLALATLFLLTGSSKHQDVRQLSGMSAEELAALDPAMFDEADTLTKAISALGGEEALMSMSMGQLEMDVVGAAYGIFEATTPDQVVNFTTYRRNYQIAEDRMKVEDYSVPLFESFVFFPAYNVTRILQGNAGVQVGQGVFSPPGPLTSAGVAALYRQQYLFNPHYIIQEILNEGTALLDSSSGLLVVDDVVSPLELSVDPNTGLIDMLTTMESNQFGDVKVQIYYQNWTVESASGLLFPQYITEVVDDDFVIWEEERLLVTTMEQVDESVFELPPNTSVVLDAENQAFGLYSQHLESGWFSAGFGSFSYNPPILSDPVELVPNRLYFLPTNFAAQGLVIGFGDNNAILVEAPASHLYGVKLLEEVQKALPGSTVTHLIQSHHHIDHAGGVREVMAQTGAQLVVGHAITDWYADHVFGNAATLVPDGWSERNLTGADANILAIEEGEEIVLVDETDFTVSVGSFPVEHGEDLLLTLVETPQAVYIYVADIYNGGAGFTVVLGGPPTFFGYLRGQNLIDENCEASFPLFIVSSHGAVLSLEEALAEQVALGLDVGC